MKARNHINLLYSSGWFCLLLPLFFLQSLSAQVSVEMTGGITTDATGMIKVECNGNWLNSGNLFPGSSTLLLQDTFPQTLKQEGGSFHHLAVNKTLHEVSLSGNILVAGGLLNVISQDVNLNGHIITLDTQAMMSETAGNTVKGSEGYITTTRMLSAPADNNVAGMGLTLTSIQNFGTTEIRRGHAVQIANGEQSILRYYDVMPQFNSNMNATVRFNYDESELNGQDETALMMYRSPDAGVNWEPVPGVLNIAGHYFEATGVNTFSRFTLSSRCMETCIVTQANVQTTTVYLNSAGLAYLTPAAVNNGSTGACGIDTMWVTPEVFDCDDVGSQEVILTVRDVHGCEKTAAMIIEVRDDIAPEVHCKNITLQLHQSCLETITPDDIDDGSTDACGISRSINVSSFTCSNGGPNNVILTVIDPSGNSASCTAVVNVLLPVSVMCHDLTLNIGAMNSININPYDLLEGPLSDYAGFTFVVEPATLYCDQLGANLVTITGTDPFGEVTVCQTIVYLEGPDADCDDVSDACDLCDGGDDQVDTDNDGIPNCLDWDGWENLIPAWQCAANKVFVCHEGNVICINENAVLTHLGHGDLLGPCEATSCPEAMAQSIVVETVLEEDDDLLGFIANDQQLNEGNGCLVIENHPNPFNDETWIRIYLPSSNEIVISVFDMMGKPVVIMANDHFEKGWHEFRFDGREYPAGVYYYRLEHNGQSKMKSMVLMND